MNHHLRFAIGTVSALSLTLIACSTKPSQPPRAKVALKTDEVRYRIHFFEAPEGTQSKTSLQGVLSPEEGQEMLHSLQKKKGFNKKWAHSVTTKKGQKGYFENIREFFYSTEYNPPKWTAADERSNHVFPVTPATPKNFKKTTLGFTGNFQTRKIHSDNVSLSLKIDQRTLLGFTNHGAPITTPAKDFWGRPVDVVITENRMEVPDFATHKLNTDLTVKDGQFILIKGSHRKKDHGKLPYREQEHKICSENFVMLIEVESGH